MTSLADPEVLSRIAFEAIWMSNPLPLQKALVQTGWSQRQLRAAIDKLVNEGRLQLHEADIVGAHGLTLRSTAHHIVHDGRQTHTWCAYDAVGIPAALRIDARVVTSCPTCRARLEVALLEGVPDDQPLVVWMPRVACEHVMRDFCPAANMFCSHAHLDVWRRTANSPDGAAMTLAGIAELGRRAWADIAVMRKPGLRCAECGCVVDRGLILEPCGQHPACCCRDLPVVGT